nr:MAG TPA: hypothetical protein [Caudoviricetes sp.]DAV95157.1 MAG TPA: hypothetical protein [Caudoviricetes sp.]
MFLLYARQRKLIKRRNDIMNCHIRMSTSFVIALIALFIVIKLCF